MKQQAAATAAFLVFAVAGCSSSPQSDGGGAQPGSSDGGSKPQDAASPVEDASNPFGDSGGFGSGTPASNGDGSSAIPTTLAAVIRDFRFYDAGDPTTNPDFENPPAVGMTTANGWDDTDIVSDTLGTDDKPVYKTPGATAATAATTLTTHGQAQFDQWYRDVAGTNIHVDYPLPITANADGSYGYDSQTDGEPYNVQGVTGDGFFPIDDGSPYQTLFGNQGEPHNYSFTVEIHTVFTYMGGEYFNFRGDDDVFVFINGKLVINLGGIHGPEPGTVIVDMLGLSVGQTYPLDFFSAERHVVGSNIEFETTLSLRPPK
ncbi:MAG TPA: fibro-slime domain-containing protein [Polyangiaceae bacterium]|jgi:fibro-slime domain-containing protein